MAASDNGNYRRQRRRSQSNSQPTPVRQETSRTIADRSGSSKRQNMSVPLSRRLSTNFQSNQLTNRDGLNWWQQIFGPPSRRPTSPTRRLQRHKSISLDERISSQAFDRTTLANGLNVSDLRSARSKMESSPLSPFSQPQEKRNTREGSPAKIRDLHLNQPKAKERFSVSREAGSRFGTQKLVAIASPAKKPSQDRNLTQISGKDRKRKKSLPRGNQASGSGMQVSLPPIKRKSTSRPNSPQPKRTRLSPLLYSSRLLILGIGLSVVIGTLLSIWSPANHNSPNKTEAVHPSESSTTVTGVGLKPASASIENSQGIELRREITPLKSAVQAITSQYPEFTPGIFILDIDTGAYLDWNADAELPAASTIKLPILLAFFQDVDAGKIRLDEKLALEKEDIASGSGQMQYKKPGTQYTALETATQMIIISDNSATNMLIDRLGGAEALNQRFREWGLQTTTIRNKLPDIEGTNTTSPKELASLMVRLNQGELVSLTSRDRLLDIMQRTQNRSLLPKGLGKEAKIAHKTGNIGSLVADVGSIDLPSGKRYIAAVMVKRPRNDTRATEFINKISRLVYEHFSRPASSPKLPSEDSAIPANSILSPNNPDDRSEQTKSADARNRRE